MPSASSSAGPASESGNDASVGPERPAWWPGGVLRQAGMDILHDVRFYKLFAAIAIDLLAFSILFLLLKKKDK